MQADPNFAAITQWIGPIIMFVVVVLAVTIPAAIVIVMRGRRSSKELPPGSPAIEDRLARIENAVESIAIEVERISESQRFSAKLQAEPDRQQLKE